MLTVERVTIPGEAGRLAGELSYAQDSDAEYLALLLNPHPHMGGSMRNGLIAHLATAFPGAGAVSFTFDYRGVGGSEGAAPDVAASIAEFWRTGHAPEDEGMLRDARAALRWAKSQAPGLPVVLVGYSFGAAAAVPLLLRERPVAAAILIAPTLRQHDFSAALAPATPPMLVIYSDNDFATPCGVTESWLSTIDAEGRCIRGGDHFFLGREGEVARACQAFASRALRRRAEAKCS